VAEPLGSRAALEQETAGLHTDNEHDRVDGHKPARVGDAQAVTGQKRWQERQHDLIGRVVEQPGQRADRKQRPLETRQYAQSDTGCIGRRRSGTRDRCRWTVERRNDGKTDHREARGRGDAPSPTRKLANRTYHGE
jgi:hypothetical protein